jgi:hypothetical protein
MLAEDGLEEPSVADSAADPGSAALHQREKELQRMVSEDDVELCLAFSTLKELLASKRLKVTITSKALQCGRNGAVLAHDEVYLVADSCPQLIVFMSALHLYHSLQRQRSSGKATELCMLTYKQHTGELQFNWRTHRNTSIVDAKTLSHCQ